MTILYKSLPFDGNVRTVGSYVSIPNGYYFSVQIGRVD